MSEIFLYIEKETIYVLKDDEELSIAVEDFEKLKLKGKVRVVISHEITRQKVINVPTKQKISLKKMMPYEAMELAGVTDANELKYNYIFNWRKIGEDEENNFYLLYLVEKKDVFPVIDKCTNEEIKIIDIICFLDLLLEIAKELTQKKDGIFIFFLDAFCVLLAISNGIYVFYRRFNIALESLRFLEENDNFFLEIRRSIFYIKQNYKSIPLSFFLICAPKEIVDSFRELQEELGAKEVREVAFSHDLSRTRPLFLYQQYLDLSHRCVSLVPYEFVFEKRIRYFSYATIIAGIVFFIISINLFYKAAQKYENELDNIIKDFTILNRLKKEMVNVDINVREVKKRLEEENSLKSYSNKTTIFYPILTSIAYLQPKGIYLKELIISQKNVPKLILKGNFLIKDSKIRIQILKKYISNLENCPLVENIFQQDELNDVINQGSFTLILTLNRVGL